VTQRGGVVTSAGGEIAPGRKKGGDDVVGLTRILLGQFFFEENTHLAATNR
jgi:hypothetical protein